jgi:hypothetical protein
MPDEQTTPQAPAPDAAPSAPPAESTAPIEPTPAQSEGQALKAQLDREIEDLWAKAEGRAEPDPVAEPTAPVKDAPPKPEPKPADAPPAVDVEAIRREESERITREAEQRQKAAEDLARQQQAQADYEASVSAYLGQQSDVDAVQAALEASIRGDYTLLDGLDVLLPTGKRSSEIKGTKGLTPDEAISLRDYWQASRSLGDAAGDRKARYIVELWNQEVVAEVNHPDVDAETVLAQQQPALQMRALRESVTSRVTARLTAEHTAVLAERDQTITDQAERIKSLENERSNLVVQGRIADTATPTAPGQGISGRRDLPPPGELSTEEFFKPGVADRYFQLIEGGATGRRRTG